MKQEKKVYILLFAILILPPIIARLAVYSDNMYLSEDFASILTFATKLGLVITNIWYGLKIGFNKVKSIFIGLIVVLPIAPWAIFVYLLSRKENGEYGQNKKNVNIEESVDEIIKDNLRILYENVFKQVDSHDVTANKINQSLNQILLEKLKEQDEVLDKIVRHPNEAFYKYVPVLKWLVAILLVLLLTGIVGLLLIGLINLF